MGGGERFWEILSLKLNLQTLVHPPKSGKIPHQVSQEQRWNMFWGNIKFETDLQTLVNQPRSRVIPYQVRQQQQRKILWGGGIPQVKLYENHISSFDWSNMCSVLYRYCVLPLCKTNSFDWSNRCSLCCITVYCHYVKQVLLTGLTGGLCVVGTVYVYTWTTMWTSFTSWCKQPVYNQFLIKSGKLSCV